MTHLPRLLIAGGLLCSLSSGAATLPDGFKESQFVGNLPEGTTFAFGPDGLVFAAQKSGALRLIRQGVLSPKPVFKTSVDSRGEHGLVGVAVDPDYPKNHFVYVNYSATKPSIHNRVSRLTIEDDKAVDEKILFESDPTGRSIFHVSGMLKFGPDRKLYFGHGDNAKVPDADNAQQLAHVFGKILRIDSDGTIPTDNPFYAKAQGNNRAIWALGLRNPFTIAFHPTTGQLYANDVGADAVEEINEITKGGNYGWPKFEGPGKEIGFIDPVYSYPHANGEGRQRACAVTGGTFYHPDQIQFPTTYFDRYFFVDYCGNWIKTLDPKTGEAELFANGIASNATSLQVGPDGALYYMSVWREGIFKISYEK